MPTYDDKPTEITCDDIDKMISMMENSEIKKRQCWKCSKDFFANYSLEKCDECYFSQFSKQDREAYYGSLIQELFE